MNNSKRLSSIRVMEVIEITNTLRIHITAQELVDNAIIPVLRKLVSVIMSCIIDSDAFGNYEVAKLFVTGGFVKTIKYNRMYDYIITTEMTKEFKRLIREKTHRTKFNLIVDTHTKDTISQTAKFKFRSKSFCYNTFLKGDLRIVASATYLMGAKSEDSNFFTITVRGEELLQKTVHIDNHRDYLPGMYSFKSYYAIKHM